MSKLVVFDPGHGGHDYGASGHGVVEKTIALRAAKKAKEYLLANYTGVRVALTRSTDKYLTLGQRTSFSNVRNADLFVSIHVNSSSNSQAHGYESFISTGTPSATMLGKFHSHMANYFSSKHGRRNRGLKRKNFYVVRYTNAPAILTENLFVSNKVEAGIMNKFADEIGVQHAIATAKVLGLKAKNVSKPQTGGLTMKQYNELKARLDRLEQGTGLTDTQRKDMKKFLGYAYESKMFHTDHRPRVDKMTQEEAVGLALSYLGRLADKNLLPK